MRTTADAVAIEVLSQTDPWRVRAVALTATAGLARGMPVRDTGAPLQAPVGKAIRSRMFNVFGDAIDAMPAPDGLEWRSVHSAPPALASDTTGRYAQEGT